MSHHHIISVNILPITFDTVQTCTFQELAGKLQYHCLPPPNIKQGSTPCLQTKPSKGIFSNKIICQAGTQQHISKPRNSLLFAGLLFRSFSASFAPHMFLFHGRLTSHIYYICMNNYIDIVFWKCESLHTLSFASEWPGMAKCQ